MTIQGKLDGAEGLEGTPADGSPVPGELHRPLRLVLLGAPGVGKGTQGELLRERLGISHLSTGDLFRAAGSRNAGIRTPAMEAALHYMRRGELVPDATVWDLVRDKSDSLRSREGFLLDGFPRTLAQAEMLKTFMDYEKLPLSAVVNYEMPQSEIVMRLSGWRICAKCKSVFHVTWRPAKTEGVCDECGGRLYRRDDDNPDSIAIRLDTYQRSTALLIEFYKDLGVLLPVDADGSPEEVFARTMGALKMRVG